MTMTMYQHRTQFLSTPSARRATVHTQQPLWEREISIHALREEGDLIGVLHAPEPQISIHALREEGDRRRERRTTRSRDFYPRPPRGGRPAGGPGSFHGRQISIHALREEGDAAVNDLLQRHNISIHALREEGDPFRHRSERVKEDFYPRPPRGGRLEHDLLVRIVQKFLSTPSARRATHSPQCGSGCKRYFYPRPPRGGRPSPLAPRSTLTRFLSTPSARRATPCRRQRPRV